MGKIYYIGNRKKVENSMMNNPTWKSIYLNEMLYDIYDCIDWSTLESELGIGALSMRFNPKSSELQIFVENRIENIGSIERCLGFKKEHKVKLGMERTHKSRYYEEWLVLRYPMFQHRWLDWDGQEIGEGEFEANDEVVKILEDKRDIFDFEDIEYSEEDRYGNLIEPLRYDVKPGEDFDVMLKQGTVVTYNIKSTYKLCNLLGEWLSRASTIILEDTIDVDEVPVPVKEGKYISLIADEGFLRAVLLPIR